MPVLILFSLLAVSWSLLPRSTQNLPAPPAEEAEAAIVDTTLPRVKPPTEKTLSALLPANDLTDERLADYWDITVELVKEVQDRRGLAPEQIAALNRPQLDKQIKRLTQPKADQPGEAIRWRLLRHRDETGRVRPDGLINAIREREGHLLRQVRASVAGLPTSPRADASRSAINARAGLSATGWTWLGPGNIGGRMRTIIGTPTSSTTFFAGSVGGGIWKTTNGGASWSALTGFSANLACCTLAMHPSSSATIYAGTGEGFFNGDAIRGAGIFRTVNGGTTWSQLSSTNNSNFFTVNRIAISPNGNTILAATGSGLFRSTDAGNTWSNVVPTRMLDCDFHPTDSTRCICSTSGARVWFSTNGGATFTASTGLSSTTDGFSERAEICYAAADPNIVYASIDRSSGTVFRSTNGGQSFTQQGTANFLSGQGWYNNIIWAGDPTNADRVLVGGLDIWRSTNAGVSLTRISDWTQAPTSAHADNHFIFTPSTYNGTTNQSLLIANDGGVYRSNNTFGTPTWTELNNNLGVTQFYGGSGNATTGVFYGGTQDNGTLRYTGNAEGWNTSFGGDGGFSASDPTDPNYHYGEYVGLTIHRSSNGGSSASFIYSGLTDAVNGNANFIAPFILDPGNPARMLAGGASLWRTNDVKAAVPVWTAIKVPSVDLISAIAVSRLNSDKIWVGHNNGDLYYTTDGTSLVPTWTKVDGAFLPNRYLERVAIDPKNDDTVYVSFGGFSSGNVWKTTSAGASWTNISNGLPSAPVNGLAVHPTNSNWIYAGTEVGIYGSDDGGNTWSTSNEGPVNVSVDELTFVGNKLLAVTHGRGMYTIVPGSGGGGGGGTPTNVVSFSWNAANRTLTINGDATDNTLTATWRNDRIVLTSSRSTRILNNGAYTTSATQVTGKGAVRIAGDLQGGNDSLSLVSMPVSAMTIRFGAGNDKLSASYSTIQNCNPDGGTGTDTFTSVGSTISPAGPYTGFP